MDDVRSETTSEDNQEARNEPVAHGPRPPHNLQPSPETIHEQACLSDGLYWLVRRNTSITPYGLGTSPHGYVSPTSAHAAYPTLQM